MKGFSVYGKLSHVESRVYRGNDSKEFIVRSTDPTKWTGIQLGLGKYIIKTKSVSGAEQGFGNTSNRIRNAILRFTLGPNIYFQKRDDLTYGKSSAGMKCTPSGYVNTGEPLDLKKEFCLLVKKDSVEVKQNGQNSGIKKTT